MQGVKLLHLITGYDNIILSMNTIGSNCGCRACTWAMVNSMEDNRIAGISPMYFSKPVKIKPLNMISSTIGVIISRIGAACRRSIFCKGLNSIFAYFLNIYSIAIMKNKLGTDNKTVFLNIL